MNVYRLHLRRHIKRVWWTTNRILMVAVISLFVVAFLLSLI